MSGRSHALQPDDYNLEAFAVLAKDGIVHVLAVSGPTLYSDVEEAKADDGQSGSPGAAPQLRMDVTPHT